MTRRCEGAAFSLPPADVSPPERENESRVIIFALLRVAEL